MSLENDNVKVVRNNGEAKIKIKNKIGAVLLVGLFGLLFYIGAKVFLYNDYWPLQWSRFNYESQ